MGDDHSHHSNISAAIRRSAGGAAQIVTAFVIVKFIGTALAGIKEPAEL